MTIGHFGSRHGSSRDSHHHYSYHHNHHSATHHDAFHDDGQMLPRIDFPSGQFDRLLRGAASNNNNNGALHRYSTPGATWKSSAFEGRKK